MVKVSTLFHRVDGFNKSDQSSHIPDLLDQDLEDKFLHKVLEQLLIDPGDKLVQTILNKI
jgi:hypothetical protein